MDLKYKTANPTFCLSFSLFPFAPAWMFQWPHVKNTPARMLVWWLKHNLSAFTLAIMKYYSRYIVAPFQISKRIPIRCNSVSMHQIDETTKSLPLIAFGHFRMHSSQTQICPLSKLFNPMHHFASNCLTLSSHCSNRLASRPAISWQRALTLCVNKVFVLQLTFSIH